MIDRVVSKLGRRLFEAPVGFKWFTPGLFDGSCCFGGEESAGASFLRFDGSVWTTDKDGPIMDLLAAEITARTGKDPSEHYRELTREFGTPHYTRIDAAATPEQKAKLGKLSPAAVTAAKLAGEPITAKLTRAPGNDAPIGGLKVVAANGWFAARPSGTENVYKLYAESFKDERHLQSIVAEAQQIVDNALGGAMVSLTTMSMQVSEAREEILEPLRTQRTRGKRKYLVFRRWLATIARGRGSFGPALVASTTWGR